MTKEELIIIALSYYKSGNLDLNAIYNLIAKFLMDNDIEKYNLIKDYLPQICHRLLLSSTFSFYVTYALNYFENKFNIVKLYDNKGNLITLY